MPKAKMPPVDARVMKHMKGKEEMGEMMGRKPKGKKPLPFKKGGKAKC